MKSWRKNLTITLLSAVLCASAPYALANGEGANGEGANYKHFANGQAYIAIIIDDLGHNQKKGERAIKLQAPLTYSVLPHAAFSESLSQQAHAAQKEVMVHLPMENLGNQMALGPGSLTRNLDKTEFLQRLEKAIANIPHAKGLNNHTGSYLTQRSEQMTWLMEDMKDRNFFFVDSRTTHKSVAYDIAQNHAVLSASRDVFLDNDKSIYAIHQAFVKLLALAKERGTAIAIGHPYDETILYLESALPHLKNQNITLIPASSLLALRQQLADAKKSLSSKKLAAD